MNRVLNEIELILKAKDGCTESLEYLIERYKYVVYAVMNNLSPGSFATEDFIQEARIAIIEAIKVYDPNKESFLTLCFAYIKSRLCDLLRKESAYSGMLFSLKKFHEETTSESSCDVWFMDRMKTNLTEALPEIPLKERACVKHYYEMELSQEEEESLPNENQRKLLRHRGMTKLKKLLQKKRDALIGLKEL